MVDEYDVLPPVPKRCSLLLRGGLAIPWRSGVCPLPPIVFMLDPAPPFFDWDCEAFLPGIGGLPTSPLAYRKKKS